MADALDKEETLKNSNIGLEVRSQEIFQRMNDLIEENKMMKGKYNDTCDKLNQEKIDHANMKIHFEDLLGDAKKEYERQERDMHKLQKQTAIERERFEDTALKKEREFNDELKELRKDNSEKEQELEGVKKFQIEQA